MEDKIVMKTFIGDSGDYEEMSLQKVLDFMTDDWIDSEITGANTSELRDVCKKLYTMLAEKNDIISELEEQVKDAETIRMGDEYYISQLKAEIAQLTHAKDELINGKQVYHHVVSKKK